ncbi:MAG TPA: class I tRNA ligase family protein [Acidimicrobiales bacterium]|nr:class I tRNA ligase family protein [Acidimicrobiales bacterium]
MGRFYQTTPIYYVNDAPHVGHAYTTVVADALARWHRQAGDEVFFLTGTDEHGLKVAQSAEARGVTPSELAATNAERFSRAWAELDISNDDFIRTTEPRHRVAVQAFLSQIRDNGYIELGTYEGRYCVSCEAYYTEEELVEGNCPVHGASVVAMKEENYFFKLSAFQQPLLDWYDANPEAVAPEAKRNEALGFIRSGLQDISITRTSLSWGVPVPWDEGHVFYVWYDALVNYLTAIGYAADEERFARWWPAVHHLIGKEILRFHCVWWPAMCLAAGIEPPHQVFVHGWLLVGGEKMSKTRLNQIAPGDLVADFGVDAVRYHLLRHTSLGADGDFTYEGMVARYNSDLANNLGNLLSRVATVVGSKCGGTGPPPRAEGEARLAGVAAGVAGSAAEAWQRPAPQEALEATWGLIRETNAELEAAEPWKAEPGPEVEGVLGDALEALRIVAVLAAPAMPRACGEVWRRLGLAGSPLDARLPEAVRWGGYPGGVPVERGAPLFPRRRA